MDEEEPNFERPKGIEWMLFEDATTKLFQDWDITQHALSDEWAGPQTEHYCDRVLDHLLANFAERWLEARTTKVESIAEFLSQSVSDHFEVEVAESIAWPLAKVVKTLYDECRNQVLTGVAHVLGEKHVEDARQKYLQESMVVERVSEVPANVVAAPSSTNISSSVDPHQVTQAPLDDQIGEKAVSDDISEERTGEDKAEEDGWTVVSSKKKGKKKGKQFS